MLERVQGDGEHGGGYDICLDSVRLPAEAATELPGRGRTTDLVVPASPQADSQHQGGAPSMRTRTLTTWAVAIGCLLAPLAAYSQSLGDAAAAESRRRATARPAGGVSTQTGSQTTSTKTNNTTSTSSTSTSGRSSTSSTASSGGSTAQGG